MPQSKSRALVVTTRSWTAVEPFLRALERAGFAVAMVHGQAGGRVLHDASVALYLARPMQFRHTIERTIQDLAPDLVVPTDEPSFQHLREIYAVRSEAGRIRSPVARAIAKSLGEDPTGYDSVMSSAQLQQLAREHGLPMPNFVEVEDETSLRALLESVPLPVMLKGEGGWAGGRSEMVRSADAGIAAYHRITGAPQVTALWKEQNRLYRLADLLAPQARIVTVQQYVDGVFATRALVCRDGQVVAGANVEPLDGRPAMVGKVIEHPEMDAIAAKVAHVLGLSGLLAIEFMLEHATRQPWLIAVRPYATAIAQLAVAGDPGLAHALVTGFSGPTMRRESDGTVTPFRRDARAAPPVLAPRAASAPALAATGTEGPYRGLPALGRAPWATSRS